jgi:hypothetical protein
MQPKRMRVIYPFPEKHTGRNGLSCRQCISAEHLKLRVEP